MFRDSESNQGMGGEIIGRYTLHSRIAAGGMASVYLGTMTGAADFSRVVAIKRMHPQFASDPAFVRRFRAEAWLSCRLLHPSIVQTFDVVELGSELLLVMEYIDGITLRALCADAGAAVSQVLAPSITAGILVPALHGLHAAHMTTDDEDHPLGIVHRDFSPQNIIVGRDGHAKILDFGIARAKSHAPVTGVGQLSGKFGYLAPEQILGGEVDHRTDIFAAGIVLWEALTGERLFREPGLSEASVINRVLSKAVPPPSRFNSALPRSLDDVVVRALQREPAQRFESAREMALELEAAVHIATPSMIANCLAELSAPRLARLSRGLARTRRHAAAASRSLAKRAISVDVADANDLQQTVVSTTPLLSSAPPPANGVKVDGQKRWRLLGGFVLLLTLGLSGWALVQLVGSPERQQNNVSLHQLDTTAVALTSASLSGTSTNPVESDTVRRIGPAGRERAAPEIAARPVGANSRTSAETASVGEPRTSTTKATPSKRTTLARVAQGAATAAPKPNCDPPTFMDSEGIRHFKDGCL